VSIARWILKEVGGKAPPEEYELNIRLYSLDEFASQNKIRYYQKVTSRCSGGYTMRGEGYYSYPGRPDLKWSEVSRGHIRWLMSAKS